MTISAAVLLFTVILLVKNSLLCVLLALVSAAFWLILGRLLAPLKCSRFFFAPISAASLFCLFLTFGSAVNASGIMYYAYPVLAVAAGAKIALSSEKATFYTAIPLACVALCFTAAQIIVFTPHVPSLHGDMPGIVTSLLSTAALGNLSRRVAIKEFVLPLLVSLAASAVFVFSAGGFCYEFTLSMLLPLLASFQLRSGIISGDAAYKSAEG